MLILALALAATAPPADPPVPAVRARPLQPHQSYFRSGDYPMEAAQFGAQGSVEFQVTVGADGRVKRCRAVRTSRITIFAGRTCAILRERARYEPARDAGGNAVPDTDSGRVYWGLRDVPAPIPPPRRRTRG